MTAETDPPRPVRRRALRRFLWTAPVVIIFAGALAYPTVHYHLTHVVTDDAFVDAPLVAVSASMPEHLRKVCAAEGDTVHKGQIVANLEDALYRSEWDAAQARADNAQSLLREAELTLETERRKAGPTVELGQAELVAWQARLSGATAALDDAQQQYQRMKQLAALQYVSESELESARIRRDQRRAELDAVREEVRKATASRALADEVVETVALQKQRVETAQTELRRARAECEEARVRLQNTQVPSPVHGVVAYVSAKSGERVDEGQTICLVRDLDALWVVANVEETQIRYVRPGQTANITVDAFPGRTFHGRVDHVGPVTKSQFALIPRQSRAGNFVKVIQRLPVRIAMIDADSLLKPGMSAVVGISLAPP